MSGLAKLTRPKLHQIVPRERLFERLDGCRARPLLWIVAPPGAGKTALVASYLQARRIGGYWYQLDAGDHDTATFFHYLSQAVAPRARQRVTPLPRLLPEHRADLAGFARLYFRSLFAHLKAPAALVLDDYHELSADADLHALLETMTRELPDGISLIVISRADPPPHCASLRALDRLVILDWDELRLSLDETRRIAGLRHALDETLLQAVHAQVGGWMVGLTLTLARVKRFGTADPQINDAARDVLFTYFAAQIFDSLPALTRKVLTVTALLPNPGAAQAARLSGEPEAAAVLDGLYRRRLFVDRRGEAYHYHDLFRAFLLQQFEASYDAVQARDWRARAITVLHDSAQIEDAFALASSAAEWDTATQLLLGFAPHLFEQGRGMTLRMWLDRIPTERVAMTPWLGFWQAVGLSAIAPVRARERFATVFEQFPSGSEDAARLLCCGGVMMTHYFELDDLAPLDTWIDTLIALLPAEPDLPADAPRLRVQTALLFGLSFHRPQPDRLAACIARIDALLQSDCPINARIDAAAMLLTHHANSMDLDQAARVAALVEPWLADPHLSPFDAALWWMQLGNYWLKRCDTTHASNAYERAQAIARDNALTIPVLNVYCQIGLAYLALARGDADTAEAARNRAAAHWTSARRIDTAMDAGLRAAIAAHRGEMDAALVQARRQLALVDEVGIIWHRFYSRIELAFALAETGAADQIDAVLTTARELLRDTAYARLTYQTDLIAAYAALLRGEAALANELLATALAASRDDPGKFFLRLLPRLLPRLFGQALAAGIEVDYVSRMIREFALRAPHADSPRWPWPLQIRALGGFEVLCDGKPLTFSRKLPRKTLALLKAIITLGAEKVSEQRLIDIFWADEDGDAAARSLDATVLRLRSLLGDAAAIVQQGGHLRLDRERVWVDVAAFERALAAAAAAESAHHEDARHHWETAIALYRGAFLAEDEGEAWPVALRERLRGRFIHALVAFGAHLEHLGDSEAAIAVYQGGLDVDAVVESFYQGLMRCYERLQRRSEAISAYRRLKQILSVTLGLAPSPVTERLYQSLRATDGPLPASIFE